MALDGQRQSQNFIAALDHTLETLLDVAHVRFGLREQGETSGTLLKVGLDQDRMFFLNFFFLRPMSVGGAKLGVHVFFFFFGVVQELFENHCLCPTF